MKYINSELILTLESKSHPARGAWVEICRP